MTFNASLNGKTITMVNGQITIGSNVTIDASSLSRGIIIHGNSARIFCNNALLTLVNVSLTKGKGNAGGAILNYAELNLVNCFLYENYAGMVGGAIYNSEGTAYFFDCFFYFNEATNGAAVWNYNGGIYATNCLFTENVAEEKGGALGNGSGEIVLSNSLVAQNSANNYYGGAIYNSEDLFLYNTTVADNYAGASGGGIYNDGAGATLELYNAIVATNYAGTSGNDIGKFSTSAERAYYTLSSYTSWIASVGTVVYDSSIPLFTDPSSLDYTLVSGAQAIDQGKNSYALDPYGDNLDYDLNGGIRIVNSTIDMGAYEFAPTVPEDFLTITDYNGSYDGDAHSISIDGVLEGDTILYSTDGTTYQESPLSYTDVGSYTVYVSVTRPGFGTQVQTGTVTISKRLVDVSVSADSKVYDGTLTAVGTSTLSGVVDGDDVTLLGGSFLFDTCVAGTNKKVTFEGYLLTGSDSSNYTISSSSVSTTASIYKKALMVVGSTVDDKVYDGTTEATVNLGEIRGLVPDDAVTVIATGQFSSASIGTHDVTVSYQISGSSALNYVAPEQEMLTASIIKNSSPVDLDGDGFIGPGDYAFLSSHWFTSEGSDGWDARCDIDRDGFVGPGDFSYLSINWLKSVDDDDFVNPPGAAVLPQGEMEALVEENSLAVPSFRSSAADEEDSQVSIILAAVSQPTENIHILNTGVKNFGTFYYLSENSIPTSTREAVINNETFYLEVWVTDKGANGNFVSSIQFQLDYASDQIFSLNVEDIYAGKYTLSEFQYYDQAQNYVKAVQVAWLFSPSLDWTLIQPITNGENAWLLARFVVTLDVSFEMTPSFTVTGVTDPISPFVCGFYYVRTKDLAPIDDEKIRTINIPSYSRLWSHSPDIDKDGVISTGDWALLLDAWHTGPGDTAWNEDCDITGNGYIDDDDLEWLIENWFKVWP
ncbi:MAG: YDG domain-containing protein [Thermoguttaceae bacterium]